MRLFLRKKNSPKMGYRVESLRESHTQRRSYSASALGAGIMLITIPEKFGRRKLFFKKAFGKKGPGARHVQRTPVTLRHCRFCRCLFGTPIVRSTS
ncbi:hypothetical protein [Lacticaseibacillus mingshuiensis]|uniref:hypothetical protein n=1 Tax=Lacticaseibacillus mingshuiensis TaxID=2799574 RepID=UPI0036D21493